MGIITPQFHGKKGRSGRGTLVSEMLKKRVVNKAWEKKDKKMSDVDATQIILKDMTLKTDITSGGKPIPLLQGINVHTNNSTTETSSTPKED